MSDQLLAAITGAICGGLASGAISLVKHLSETRSLKKAMKVGLYFEIDHHNITHLNNDKDGQPNFLLTGFQDYFYRSHISSIVKLLGLDVLMHLAFYYAKLNLVKEWQDDLFKLNERIDNIVRSAPHVKVDKVEYESMVIKHNSIKELLRVTSAPCINARDMLMANLKHGLSKDPSTIAYIDVPANYQVWWESKLAEKSK